jgi:pyrophosphate--fructose-6-phosphate 1-phosphotransferase
MENKNQKIGILTSGGIAPCISNVVEQLIKNSFQKIKNLKEIIAYKNGFKGIFLNKKIIFNKESSSKLYKICKIVGGSPIGNSRINPINKEDCFQKGLIQKVSDNPLNNIIKRLLKDKIKVLYTIGGDDTILSSYKLLKYIKKLNLPISILTIPKTIDNDIYPIHQTFGAITASIQGALFFRNIVSEHTSEENTLIIHEIMGRNCGWLTAATAWEYQKMMRNFISIPKLGLNRNKRFIHSIFIPEMKINMQKEILKISNIMKRIGNINIFISEGVKPQSLIKDLKIKNKENIMLSSLKNKKKDPFGNIKLDDIQIGEFLSKVLKNFINFKKVIIQKSGYFSRSSCCNQREYSLVSNFVKYAIEGVINKESGVIGQNSKKKKKLEIINFKYISGRKPFNIKENKWFKNLLKLVYRS